MSNHCLADTLREKIRKQKELEESSNEVKTTYIINIIWSEYILPAIHKYVDKNCELDITFNIHDLLSKILHEKPFINSIWNFDISTDEIIRMIITKAYSEGLKTFIYIEAPYQYIRIYLEN